MRGSECWVTLAESDGEGWAAAVLGRSIRKSLSDRAAVIAISENVSQPMKVFLQREFDTVLKFESSEVRRKGLGKLWLWNLRCWNKCVFISPYSYMLSNCDELFSKPCFSAIANQDSSGFCPNLFVFRPNLLDFDHLLELANTKDDPSKILNNQFEIPSKSHQIDASFAVNLNGAETSTEQELNANIILFDDLVSKSGFALHNAAEELKQKWISTFVHEIIPSIELLQNEKEALYTSLEQCHLPTANGPAPMQPPQIDIGEYHNAIAVVGMSCRFPGANSSEEFWDLLISGKDPVRRYPAERPRPSHQTDLDESNFEAGFLKCPVDEFDAKFFGISPREAPFVDPQQRLLLEVIWESLENANINPLGLQETNTGVFVGIWQQEYDQYIPDSGLTANEYHHRYLGNAFSATASRISHFLGLYGPNYSIESGCSSSSSAIHLACQSLRRGESSLAVASGVNLVLHYVNPLGGDDAGAVVLATDYRCKTFDERADGFVRAEGCGAVVLKPIKNAIRDGDNILGLIRGTALNNDGPATSFGTPNAKAQERVFREALADAGIEPCEVSLVEAHGTGTIVGDPTEMYAIGKVYSENRSEPLTVSSVKTNIGHAEACAGMAGLIKILLCLKHKKIPPHLHFEKLNPRIQLDDIPAVIPLEVTDWSTAKRIAAVSSFSMSGTNVHLVIQETPPLFLNKPIFKTKQAPMEMVGISAKSEEGLEALCQKYICHFENNPDLSLVDIAHTLNTGRANMSHRIGVVAKDAAQLLSKLTKKTYVVGRAPTQKAKIIFLFTGQGSQYFGMAKGLYDACSTFRTAFSKCEILFRKYLKCSLKKVLWGEPALLEQTVYCQPAIFCVQYSLLQLWKSFGIKPDFVLGHSVGEFCAAVCAGVLSLDDAMKLVVSRSQIVDSLDAGSMLVVKTSASETRRLIKDFGQNNADAWIDVAAENSTEETVVSGIGDNVTNFGNFCTARGCKTQGLSASHAFHSRQMDPVLSEFGTLCGDISPGTLKCTYISATCARELKAGEFSSNYWVRHLRDTVRFQEAVKFLTDTVPESKVFFEIGAQPILLSLVMANMGDSATVGTFCPSLRKTEEDLSAILNSLAKAYVAGVDISWQNWYSTGNKLILPTYPFQRQKYWIENENDGIPMSPILHPLIGRHLQSPITDHVFTQMLCTKELPYVSDHRVAERVILPAAAYLEMIMVAGCHVLQGGRVQVPFAVEGLLVEAALELSKACQVQTLVRSLGGEDGVQFEIGIHKQVSREELDNWKRHAVASFAPSHHNTAAVTFDLAKMQQRLTPVESIAKAYEGVAKAGIQFGPKFQSIAQAWKSETELLTQLAFSESSAPSYICHPIILDAMIQTFAFRSALISPEKYDGKMKLPISIAKFSWLAREATPTFYVYCQWGGAEEAGLVTLLNEFGQSLATMEGIELITTSVTNFLRIMNTDTLPSFLEEVWRPGGGVTRNRMDPRLFQIEPAAFTQRTLETVAGFEENCMKGVDITGRMMVLFLQRAILECNVAWPGIGEPITMKTFTAAIAAPLRILKTDQLLETLSAYGVCSKAGEGEFSVLQEIPALEELERRIAEEYQKQGVDSAMQLFTKRVDAHFTSVLQGKLSPIEWLFPSNGNEAGALRFYKEVDGIKEANELATSVLLDCVSHAGEAPGILRILEVGGGSGLCCSHALEGLDKLSRPFAYTFTDISPAFLIEARKKFSRGVTFDLFNIEEDPLCQGIRPEEYDIILGDRVVHATENIGTALRNLRAALRPNGLLVISEQLRDMTICTLSFGFLDGWWRFKDHRRGSSLLSQEQWTAAVEQCGFGETKVVTMLGGIFGVVVSRKLESTKVGLHRKLETASKLWLNFSDCSALSDRLSQKMNGFGRTVLNGESFENFPQKDLEGILFIWTKFVDAEDQQNCRNLLTLCQNFVLAYQDVKNKPKLFLVTRGVNYLGDAGPGNANAATSTSFLRTFANENPDISLAAIDLDQDEVDHEREAEELFSLLWTQDKEMCRAIREDKVFIQRLVSADQRKGPIPFPNSNRFKISNPASKSLNDLEISFAPKIEPIGEQVEVGVRATALNFRDIFMILQPEGFEISENVNKEPGLDIAGIVSAVGPECTKFAVGDAVFGFADGSGLASHVIVDSRFLIRKPLEMTFTSAATIPVAFLTVLYSFQNCAQLAAGDRVLIHVATGGVGLAAIQTAQHIGAEIFATAGSRRKRAYLRQIGVRHVYHSRNTAFGDEILKDTHGAGVNVVLNSLTGPNFKEASLRACAHGARFVEIGKVNIWTAAEVKDLRPDVEYFVVDLSANARDDDPSELQDLSATVEREFSNGVYRGLPHETFPMDLIKEAFFYFQEAKHIGKIVLNVPEVKMAPEGRFTVIPRIFHRESCYLITGGLGGIGLEVAKWMGRSGAGSIVLVGRNPPSPRGQEVIKTLNDGGTATVVIRADVGVYAECESLLAKMESLKLGPLRGIMHAAGVLSDAIIMNQCWDKFDTVFNPKVRGTWNLHKLTLGLDLEFFAMCSSVAAIFGMPGQSNHASANRFLDSFVHYRHSLGLPASTINFGPWAEIGAAAHVQDGLIGMRLFSPAQGIRAIEKVFRERKLQCSILDVSDWSELKQVIRLGRYLDEMRSDNSQLASASEADKAIVAEILNAAPAERQVLIEDFLEKVIKDTLRIPENEQLDRDQNFSEIGVDSLMAMELRNRLQGLLGDKQLTVAALQENRTIRSLAAHITHVMNADEAPVDVATLVAQDSILPPEIQATTTPPPLPSHVSQILLTGATGHLGVNFIPALQAQNPNLVIHCIVRGKDQEEAYGRLQKTLRQYSLSDQVNCAQLKVVVGDISKENLALPLETYEALAGDVDGVVHCAVKSNHLEEYNSLGESSLRTMNALSTVNVLRFAATGKTKRVLYASSLVAVTRATEDGVLVEDFPLADDFGPSITNGYILSKFVSEKLMLQASERGIPVTVFRYASVFGNSETGYMPMGKNHSWNILLSCIRVRKFPRMDQNGIPLMAVDTAAQISSQIFLSDASETGVYNLTSASVASEEDITDTFAKFGICGEFVPFHEWRDAVFEETDFDKNVLAPFFSEYGGDAVTQNYFHIHPLANHISSLQINVPSSKTLRNCTDLVCILPARKILERHLQHHYDQLTAIP